MPKYNRLISITFGMLFFITAVFLSFQTIPLSKEDLVQTDLSISFNQPMTNSDELLLLFEEVPTSFVLTQLIAQAPEQMEILDCYETYVLLKSLDSIKNPAALLNYFKEQPSVMIAEYNQELTLTALTNDEYSDTQWPLSNSGIYLQVYRGKETMISSAAGIDLNIQKAWDYYKKNITPQREVVVAIIDTGIDIYHPELSDSIWVNKDEILGDGIDNDNNGYIDDVYGWDFYNNDSTVCHYAKNSILADSSDNDNHGTHLAGIIAAKAENRIGIAGIASNVPVKIMPLKIHGGKKGKGTIANAIKAIKYATIMGADICNMSWGTTVYSEALEQIMRESTMLFVAASGNDGNNNDSIPMYPANFELDNMISVTFINANGEILEDANYGKNSVDLAAPGQDIYSTIVGSYQMMSGTSMAAPHISAIAAMIYSSGEWYPSEVKNLILSNLTPLKTLENKVRFPGIPNTLKILKRVSSLEVDKKAPNLKIEMSYEKDIFKVRLNASDFSGSGVRVLRYASGKKAKESFQYGMTGTPIRSNELELTKAGMYTFYISDYAGNETVVPFLISEDTTPPNITASYKDKKNNSYTIELQVTDQESGVKTLEYAKGQKEISDFRSGTIGIPLTLNSSGKTSFSVKQSGVYTIYAVDYRGNKSILSLTVPKPSPKTLSLNHTGKVLTIGSEFYLLPNFSPVGSTDSVTFQSSNPAVVNVTASGLVTGVSPGVATITVKSSQGLTAKCLIVVSRFFNFIT